MIKLLEGASDKLLGLLAPQATASAEPCACDGIDSWYVQCGCWSYGSYKYVYHKQVRCDGCHLIYGSCVRTVTRCTA